jgi:prolyl oligopeptidase
MRARTIVSIIAISMLIACAQQPVPLSYPEARQGEVVDDYHGTPVPDPYRWLEELDSDETRQWIEQEQALTDTYLAAISQRDSIRERLTELWNYERYDWLFKEGDRYFYSRNDGLQAQSEVWVTDSLDSPGRLLLDPNTFSEDGTVALTWTEVSPDGKWLAYGTSSGGSDWQEWFVLEVETGELQDDHIRWIKFSEATWDAGSQGFYYCRYDEPETGAELKQVNYFQKLYYHQLGTPQSDDLLVYERPDQKEWGFDKNVTEDGRYLIISVAQGTDRRNLIFYKDLQSRSAKVVELIDSFEASYEYIANDGPVLYLQTNLDAPRGRLLAIDTRSPERASWQEIVAEDEDILGSVKVVNDTFVATYLHDAKSQIRLFSMDGERLDDVELPGIGTVRGISGHRDQTEAFFVFSSFIIPETCHRLDMTTGQVSVFRAPDVAYKPDELETEQVFYTSKDGTRIPMFISYQKGLDRNGDNPTILHGYGGFKIPQMPRFRILAIQWMEMGGIFATANLRGGGEYGSEWHDAGKLEHKQNVFDDFIAAAEWLIDNDYTSQDKLSIYGGSNGGLLVGATLNQRPDLFAAALPIVGVMDMLRFHRFTIGWAWVSDYGSPDDPEMFPVLHAYSPLHNIRTDVPYPATLVITADHDDRVFPAHSFKYTAALQAAQTGSDPILIRIETRAGHGAGKPTAKRIEEAADILAFLVKAFD